MRGAYRPDSVVGGGGVGVGGGGVGGGGGEHRFHTCSTPPKTVNLAQPDPSTQETKVLDFQGNIGPILEVSGSHAAVDRISN